MVVGVDGGYVVTGFCVFTLGIGVMDIRDDTLGTSVVLDVGETLGSRVVLGWVTCFSGDCFRCMDLVVSGAWVNTTIFGSGCIFLLGIFGSRRAGISGWVNFGGMMEILSSHCTHCGWMTVFCFCTFSRGCRLYVG